MGTSNRQAAVAFCANQLGKAWWYDTDDTPLDLDANQETWYCSELIYAAYYNATGSGFQCGALDDGHILPAHLYATWQTSTVVAYDELFLQLSIDTSDAKWTINVFNPNHTTIDVTYNKKMCGSNDAKTWTDLNDTETFSLSARSTASKRVRTNFLATHITFSWFYSDGSVNVRLISYANHLSTDGTLDLNYNIIYI